MTNDKTGRLLALAAVSVTGPRLVLVFLQADGINVWPWAETFILAVTGIGTGLVLTGGGMYIAHHLAVGMVGAWKWLFLAFCWLLLLFFSVVLIAPALVFALQNSQLNTILVFPYNWYWSIVAVLAVEVLAGAAIVAGATGENVQPVAAKEPGAFSILAGALTNRLAAEIEGQPKKRPIIVPVLAGSLAGDVSVLAGNRPIKPRRKHTEAAKTGTAKEQKMAALVTFLADNPHATGAEMAVSIGSAKATAQNYLAELELAGVVHKNGHGVQVLAA